VEPKILELKYEMRNYKHLLTVFLVGNVLPLLVNGLAEARSPDSVSVVLTAQAPSVANEKTAKRDAAGGREDSLSESAKAALSSSIGDRAAPVLNFTSGPENGRKWLFEMSKRLEQRIPDRAQRTEFLTTVHYEAIHAGLDLQLVLALIDINSGFRKYAISNSGARGYMQVMPFWIKIIGESHHNLFALRTNLRYGCVILRYYLDLEKGDTSRALSRNNGSAVKLEFSNLVRSALRGRWAYDGPKS
jgi:soluble lytic murein transglycosylase-like protein